MKGRKGRAFRHIQYLVIAIIQILLFIPWANNLASAAPIIKSSQGTFQEGATIALTGEGFGNVPTFAYSDFFDSFRQEYSFNSSMPAEQDLPESPEHINWKYRISTIKPEYMTNNLLEISHNASFFSTGFGWRQGYVYQNSTGSVFEDTMRAVLDHPMNELWSCWMMRYGDGDQPWPSPYTETGSGKIAYIWLKWAGGSGNRQYIPMAGTTASGDSPFKVVQESYSGATVGRSTGFIRGKWIQWKVHMKLNSWTSWLSIESMERANNVVTVITKDPHGIAVGDRVNIRNAGFSNSQPNPYSTTSWVVNQIIDPNTFSFLQSGADVTSTGGEVCAAKQDGTLQVWVNENKIVDLVGNYIVEDWPVNNAIDRIEFGANHSAGTQDWMKPDGQCYRYFDDVIIHTSDPGNVASVWLSNKSTWGTGPEDPINGDSNFVRQKVGSYIPSEYGFRSWTDNHVLFEYNSAGLDLNKPVFIYIRSWDGQINQQGYYLATISPPKKPYITE